jgi:hypothetical protein
VEFPEGLPLGPLRRLHVATPLGLVIAEVVDMDGLAPALVREERLGCGRRVGRGAGGRGYRVAIGGRLASRTSALKAATSVSMSASSRASSRRATSARCS